MTVGKSKGIFKFNNVNINMKAPTPMRLYLKGIVICEQCGKHCSLDYKWCKDCQSNILIILV